MGDEVTWTITQLTDWLDALIASSVPGEIWVEGEISNLNRSSSGHVYFTLIDSTATGSSAPCLNITLFDWHRNNVNHLLRRAGGAVRMANGVRVRIRGEVKLYAARSQYQLRMTTIDPAFTLGNLAAERAALLSRLADDGLLELNKARPLAVAPCRVALITSSASAASADALHEFQIAGLGIQIGVVDTLVQGVDAPASIVVALAVALSWKPDVIALVRGGGAQTDLAAFDHEAVARAVAQSTVAVWCGIGHETDRSVVDEVAHQSFKTPTACAAAIVERVRSAVATTENGWASIQGMAHRHIERGDHALHTRSATVAIRVGAGVERADRRVAAAASTLDARAQRSIAAADARIQLAAARCATSAKDRLAAGDLRLDHHHDIVRAHDPVRALARGWTITRTVDGTLVKAADLPEGTELDTHTAAGVLRSTVTSR